MKSDECVNGKVPTIEQYCKNKLDPGYSYPDDVRPDVSERSKLEIIYFYS